MFDKALHEVVSDLRTILFCEQSFQVWCEGTPVCLQLVSSSLQEPRGGIMAASLAGEVKSCVVVVPRILQVDKVRQVFIRLVSRPVH